MSRTTGLRLGSVLLLGLLLGCGGGGGDDFDDGIAYGTWYTNIDLLTYGCGPEVREVVGSDVEYPTSDSVLIKLYLEGSPSCMAGTWELHGVRTSETTYAMDDKLSEFLCELEEAYGYGTFDVTNATFTLGPSYDRFEGPISVAYDGGTCTGDLIITLTPR